MSHSVSPGFTAAGVAVPDCLVAAAAEGLRSLEYGQGGAGSVAPDASMISLCVESTWAPLGIW
jgi:hypothetical protein